MSKTPDQVLEEAAETFRQRNSLYQDSYLKAGRVLAAMFPVGITLNTVEEFTHFHLLNYKVAKVLRDVALWDQGGHKDSIHDDMVYSAMLEAFIEKGEV